METVISKNGDIIGHILDDGSNSNASGSTIQDMGAIENLSTTNFTHNNSPFYIKNDSPNIISLEVKLINTTSFVNTKFDVGWNLTERVVEIKSNAALANVDLKWGV